MVKVRKSGGSAPCFGFIPLLQYEPLWNLSHSLLTFGHMLMSSACREIGACLQYYMYFSLLFSHLIFFFVNSFQTCTINILFYLIIKVFYYSKMSQIRLQWLHWRNSRRPRPCSRLGMDKPPSSCVDAYGISFLWAPCSLRHKFVCRAVCGSVIRFLCCFYSFSPVVIYLQL